MSVRRRYTQVRGRIWRTLLSLLARNRPESSHLSSHFYNSVRSAETLLDRKARVCGIMRTNKGYST